MRLTRPRLRDLPARLSVREVAAVLGLHPLGLYRTIRRGLLCAVPSRTGGPTGVRRVEIRRRDLLDYVRRRDERRRRLGHAGWHGPLRPRAGWLFLLEIVALTGRGISEVRGAVERGELPSCRLRGDVPKSPYLVRRVDAVRWGTSRREPKGRLPLAEVARILGVSRQALHLAIRRGSLDAVQVGHWWWI